MIKRSKRNCQSQSLAVLFPDIAREWHPTLNEGLTPESVLPTSHKKVWWRCSRGVELNQKHDWSCQIRYKVKGVSKCPVCPRDRVTDANRLSLRFPEIAAEWHPTKNRRVYPTWQPKLSDDTSRNSAATANPRLKPSDVSFGSHEMVWWQCKKNKDHCWQATPNTRTSTGAGCPFCSSNKVSIDNCLSSKYPAVAKLWHPTRNGSLRPSDVTPWSQRVVWWRCPRKADHVWKAVIASVTGKDGRGSRCPYCAGMAVAQDNSLSYRFPDVAKRWHPTKNLPLTPKQVTAGSGKDVWWCCPRQHEWCAKVREVMRAFKTGNTGCPFCSGRQACVDNCLENVFPEIAKQWHPSKNAPVRASDVTYGSSKSFWWLCSVSDRHEWQAPVSTIISNYKRGGGTGCPHCARIRTRWRAAKVT